MARFVTRLSFALALSAAMYVPSGCTGGGYALRDAPGYIRASAGEGLDAGRQPAPLDVSSGIHGTMGVEVGSIEMRDDPWDDDIAKGEYLGVRYSTMLGLNWGLSFAVGQMKSSVLTGGDDLEI